jgi:hypothetical protein
MFALGPNSQTHELALEHAAWFALPLDRSQSAPRTEGCLGPLQTHPRNHAGLGRIKLATTEGYSLCSW